MTALRRDPRTNPFFVLELPVTATNVEIERAGRKLLGLLPLGSESARTYGTPLGAAARDESTVREAMNALRDPSRRVIAELEAAAYRFELPEVPPLHPGFPEAESLCVLAKR